ncbi:MAG: ABC transporter permease [Pirellulaceae bacterium]|nr:ABC transporter permease [Pirellulaceae bacterium]
MGLSRFSWREMCSRPLRAFLTFLSITIGVGAVAAVLLATATTRQAQREMLRTVSGKADIEIVADGAGFPYETLAAVTKLPQVESAVAGVVRYGVIFTDDDRKARAQILGIDPRIDQTVRDYEVAEGKLPTSLRHLMLDQGFANSLAISVGDTVKILTKAGMRPFSVVGLVRPSGGSAVTLSGAVYMVLPAAQRTFQTGANIDQIQVVLRDKAQLPDVLKTLAAQLPVGATARSVRTQAQTTQEAMFAPRNGLLMAVAFSIVIATFIIYNTFQMSVGERRKQLGILRAVGATPSQIQWMILRESIWLSLLGAAAGCVVGLYGAGFLNRITEALLQVELPGIAMHIWPFVAAVGVGMLVSLLGAIIPARSAAAVQPMEAIRAIPPSNHAGWERLIGPASFVTLPVGLLLIWLSTRGVALGLDIVGVVLILLGCVLMIPRLLQPACGALTDWLEPWLGVSARLAHKQLLRHVGRTSLTVGVLFVALATCIGMAGNILDNVNDIRRWYTRTIIGDFFVRASLPDFASGAAADLPAELQQQVSHLPGIASVSTMRFVTVQSGEESLLLVVRPFVGDSSDFFDLTAGTDQQVQNGLANGHVVIGSVLALRRRLQVGDALALESESGTIELPIAAITNDYIGGGLTVYMDREHAHDLLGVDGYDALIIKAQSDQRMAVQASLQQLCQQQGLILQSYADLIGMIDGMIGSVIGSLWVLLALGCSIAAMGLVNTLTMNILEQTREIGMLRVVAMTRGQVRRMIFIQAGLLGVLGLVPGGLFGVFVQYAIGLSSMVVLGHDVQFVFRPTLFLGAIGIGLALVLLASLIPAERASRLKLQAALQYE